MITFNYDNIQENKCFTVYIENSDYAPIGALEEKGNVFDNPIFNSYFKRKNN